MPLGARAARRLRALLACAIALGGREALADGAFPDAQSILAPANRPNEILLATNFGLVRSEDDGQTWTWSCEQSDNSYGMFYQLGAPPDDRLYTVSVRRVAFSDDLACTWQIAGGMLNSMDVIDAFADPTTPGRVLAVAQPRGDARGSDTVVESTDGGATFTSVLYTAGSSDSITGLEVARADPKTMYLTMTSLATDGGASSFLRKLIRSRDGGATWTVQDLTPSLGPGSIALLAVDPANPLRVFLRINDGSSGERLALTDDGGVSSRTALQLSGGIMQAFVRGGSNGTILVAAIVGLANALYRSRDGAATFERLPAPTPNFRGLAERDGILFGAADDVRDPFAVGYSTDDGGTWQPLMHYAQVQAIDSCVKAQCQTSCQKQAGVGLWPAAVCEAMPSPLPPRDLGSPPADARDGGPTDAAAKNASSGGCHCGTPGRPAWSGWLAFIAAALGLRRGNTKKSGQRAPKER